MKMPYVIRYDAEYRRKDGSTYKRSSYFKGKLFGVMHEFTSDRAEAKQFRTKALAEINIRNRFDPRRKMVAERVGATA